MDEKMEDQARLRIRWQSVKNHGYPPKYDDPYYGDRYSVQVLSGNETTGQVAFVAYVWDYQEEGWMYATMSEGPNACDYEAQHVTHWALWPKCRLVTLDKEKTCEHKFIPAYDHSYCRKCGEIRTDSGWGIASRMIFKNLSEAEFYKKNGRLPEGI